MNHSTLLSIVYSSFEIIEINPVEGSRTVNSDYKI